MTLEQLSAVIDVWVWIDDKVTTYGPGLGLATAGWTVWRTGRRIHIRRSIHRLEHLANHPAHRTDARKEDRP